jgi:hypothetical protein
VLFPIVAFQEPPPFRVLIVQPTYDIAKRDRGLGSLENAASGQLVEDALRKLGISNITVIKFGAGDAASPATAMRQAIKTFLIEQSRPGERLIVYYTGHGQQIADDNGARDEADGEDEAWVMPLGTDEEEHEHIRDDELTEWVEQASDKIGLGEGTARLLILSDSCHSGTMIDERVDATGNEAAAIPAAPGASDENLFDRGLVYIASSSSGALTKFAFIGEKRGEAIGFRAGPIALALHDEVVESGAAHFGYAGELFEFLRSRALSLGQHPILFGRRGSPLFNAEAALIAADPPMLATRHREEKSILALNAGELDGIRVGMAVRLVPSTQQDAKPVDAQVTDTSLRSAFLRVEGLELTATSFVASLVQSDAEHEVAVTVSAPSALRGRLGRLPGVYLVPEHGRITVHEEGGRYRVVHEGIPIPKADYRLVYEGLNEAQVERLVRRLWLWERLILINSDSDQMNGLNLSWVNSETIESHAEAVALERNFVELFDEERLDLMIRPSGNWAKWYCYAIAIDAEGGFELLNIQSDRLSVFPEHALALRGRWTRLIDGLDKSRRWSEGDFIKVITSREPLDASMFVEIGELPAPRREPLGPGSHSGPRSRLARVESGADYATQEISVMAIDGVRGSRRPSSQVRPLPLAEVGRRIR